MTKRRLVIISIEGLILLLVASVIAMPSVRRGLQGAYNTYLRPHTEFEKKIDALPDLRATYDKLDQELDLPCPKKLTPRCLWTDEVSVKKGLDLLHRYPGTPIEYVQESMQQT